MAAGALLGSQHASVWSKRKRRLDRSSRLRQKRRRIATVSEWDPVTGAPKLAVVERASTKQLLRNGAALGTCATRFSSSKNGNAQENEGGSASCSSASATGTHHAGPKPAADGKILERQGAKDGSDISRPSVRQFRASLQDSARRALLRLGMTRGGEEQEAAAAREQHRGEKRKVQRGFAQAKGRLGGAAASLRAAAAAEGDIGAGEQGEKGPSTVATSGGDWARFKAEEMGREERAALERQARHGEAAKKEFLDQARANEEDGVRAMAKAGAKKRRAT